LGPLGGLSTGQFNCCLPRMEEKTEERAVCGKRLKTSHSLLRSRTDMAKRNGKQKHKKFMNKLNLVLKSKLLICSRDLHINKIRQKKLKLLKIFMDLAKDEKMVEQNY